MRTFALVLALAGCACFRVGEQSIELLDGRTSGDSDSAVPAIGTWEERPLTAPWPAWRGSRVAGGEGGVVYYLAANDFASVYANMLWRYRVREGSWEVVSDAATASPHPPARLAYGGLVHHDAAVYLYGGTDNTQWYIGEVWRCEPSTGLWSVRATAVAPEAAADHRLVSAGAVVVLYGGLTQSGVADETWHYDATAGTWRRVTTTGSPGGLAGHGMVYEPVSGRVVLFGGYAVFEGAARDETWLYDPVTEVWRESQADERPAASAFPDMSADTARGIVVLRDSGGVLWAYAPTDDRWARVSEQGALPPSGASAGLVYDPVSDAHVLVRSDGGCGSGCQPVVATLRF